MFTGIIKEVGEIKSVTINSSGKEFFIAAPKLASLIEVDDSVATNGVCLTATKVSGEIFCVQAVHVTLEKTSLAQLRAGSRVNLELALRMGDRLGGHLVQGHVTGIAHLKEIKILGENKVYTFRAAANLFRYMIQEGSIAIDGISLTIAELSHNEFSVSLIPHTLSSTTLGTKKIGDVVNIEVDMMAKYAERFMSPYMNNAKTDKEKWLDLF